MTLALFFQHKKHKLFLFFFVILTFLFTFVPEMSNIRTYEITHIVYMAGNCYKHNMIKY